MSLWRHWHLLQLNKLVSIFSCLHLVFYHCDRYYFIMVINHVIVRRAPAYTHTHTHTHGEREDRVCSHMFSLFHDTLFLGDWGRLRGIAVACWTTDHYDACSNFGVGISEGCFIFNFASLPISLSCAQNNNHHHRPRRWKYFNHLCIHISRQFLLTHLLRGETYCISYSWKVSKDYFGLTQILD